MINMDEGDQETLKPEGYPRSVCSCSVVFCCSRCSHGHSHIVTLRDMFSELVVDPWPVGHSCLGNSVGGCARLKRNVCVTAGEGLLVYTISALLTSLSPGNR
ncbi:hypothetical protein DNTS_034797 [Danionella cerebrum]|uniref:Uncharacterized protein n=1 Tax=Danionella cerebrum TaxID=2873325 RepID=A0A553NRL5_9TELE|nr:hypothetical protein DNTS_034797 [Danionella translucida]